jgi:gallate decarboxylase subunit C
MTGRPALSVRAAMAAVRRRTPHQHHVLTTRLSTGAVAAHFAERFAGVPANGRSQAEDVVLYRGVRGASMPVLLGLYGDASRVRGWLPGLPARANRDSVRRMLAGCRAPEPVARPACQQRVSAAVDLTGLPALVATPRDAGPYLTTGVVYARDPDTGEIALSVHRMLVRDRDQLAMWMVPGRQLRAMHDRAVRRGVPLPVSINLGAPPAAMLASALNTRFLPASVTKLDVAGALAGAPLAVAPALTQPTSVLAQSEVVLEGFLDDTTADECLGAAADRSLPEFLGYDGDARKGLPVIHVTAVSTRRDPWYQAVIGPGREQSVILGLAGALSVALSGTHPGWQWVRDMHFPPAGGGMLLLALQVRKESARGDRHPAALAHEVFSRHPFVKLIVAVDEDVDATSAEDVWWAVTTRANLGVDCTTFPGFQPLPMDPSQRADWARARGGDGACGRTFIDATVPYMARECAGRSFPMPHQRGPQRDTAERGETENVRQHRGGRNHTGDARR